MHFKVWKEYKIVDAIQFNPRESIKKGDKVKKIPMEKLEPYTRKITGFEETEFTSGTKFRNGDTLLARITPCLENGKTAQVDILNENEVAFGSTEFIVLREKPGITYNNFIYYLSISPEFRNLAIKSMNGSSGRQRVQKDVLEQFPIKLPSIEEQKAIANILSILDNKIETNNQINKKLEEMAQAIFKQWFVDFEFPNKNGESYKSSGGEMVESDMGMIPKGWQYKELRELCNITSSKRIFMNEYVKEGIPFYRGKEIIEKSKGSLISTELYISIDKYNEIKDKFSVPVKGDILLTSVGTLGIPYKVDYEKFYFKDGNLTWFKDYIQNEYSNYIYLWLLSNEGQSSLESITIGSTQKALTIASLKKLKLMIPNDLLLKKFESVISKVIDKIYLNNTEKENLIKIRDNLLSKLMSGRIKVPLND